MKSLKIIIALLLTTATLLYSQTGFTEMAGKPGAFSRMGFGARGMGMGNAMSAVTEGNLVAYYNPALSVFQKGNSAQTSYSFLSLDRHLNFLNFTTNFPMGMVNRDGTARTKPRSIAGLSIGIINSGVDNFKERNSSGMVTGDLSPTENQIFLGLANKFSEKFALGLNAKFYYAKLYKDISSTTFGIDIGAIYSFNENCHLSAMLVDLLSKYKWDTTKRYLQDGIQIDEEFPTLIKIGLSYKLTDPNLLLSAEMEKSNAGTNLLRFGAEYNIIEHLFVRGGINNFNLENTDFPVRPSFGFSYFYKLNNYWVGVDYAFVIEPYSNQDQHIVGVNINF